MPKPQKSEKAHTDSDRAAANAIGNSPLKAIRAHCYVCAGWTWPQVEKCPCTDCALWPFRFGKRPTTAAAQGRDVNTETD
jgi:hypothetical protein